MNIRRAFQCLLLALAALPVQAQPQGSRGGMRFIEQELAALAERVAKLESGEIAEEDMVGTYAGFMFGINMLGSPLRDTAIIGVETSSWRVTLEADGTGMISGSFGNQVLLEGDPWLHTAECAFTPPAPPECDQGDPESLSWSLAPDGLVLTFEDGDPSEPFAVGAGGRVLIGSGFSFGYVSGFGDGSGWSVIITLIRLPDE